MNKKILSLALLLSASWASSQALAVGEKFKLETYGTLYCAGKSPKALDPITAPTYWVGVDSATQITVYLDSALTKPAFPLAVKTETLTTDARGRTLASVNAMVGPTSKGYLVWNGIVRTDLKKDLNFINVNFIRQGLTDTCSASGRMVGKRVL